MYLTLHCHKSLNLSESQHVYSIVRHIENNKHRTMTIHPLRLDMPLFSRDLKCSKNFDSPLSYYKKREILLNIETV